MFAMYTFGEKSCWDDRRGLQSSRDTIGRTDRLFQSAVYQFLRHQTQENDDDRLSHVLADWMAWIFRDLPFQHVVCIFLHFSSN